MSAGYNRAQRLGNGGVDIGVPRSSGRAAQRVTTHGPRIDLDTNACGVSGGGRDNRVETRSSRSRGVSGASIITMVGVGSGVVLEVAYRAYGSDRR